ncbi:MAG: 3-phosphoshikimate 1-carboxyvinyltransferase [Thermacetogeniaceae bacterium]
MQVIKVEPGARLAGECRVPGDKSISHRAALLGAIAEGQTEIENFLCGADCLSTLRCLESMGVGIKQDGGHVRIYGGGLRGLKEPSHILDAGNSGTTMRLLLGILSGQSFFSVLTGDDSLNERPMGRVIKPLCQMGAQIWGRKSGLKAPLAVMGKGQLEPMAYRLPVPSAQVKSALLLAGLYARGETTVIQPLPSRDHTERMLQAFGACLQVEPDGSARIAGGSSLRGRLVQVPGDISAAAFLIVAATLIPGSDILIRDVGTNPTRTGVLDVLVQMGADCALLNERCWSGEPVADLRVRSSRLRGVEIGGPLIPRLIDEIPIIAVAAAMAEGVTVIRDAAELRVKETDRIEAIVKELRKLGAELVGLPDGLSIQGGQALQGASVDSWGDHRLAMALAVAGLVTAVSATVIGDTGCTDVSFPGFSSLLSGLGAVIEQSEA